MKKFSLCLYIFFSLFNCTQSSQANPSSQGDDTVTTIYAALPVKKSVTKKVFVHLMPWFETKTTNLPIGTWGIHWTMNTQNPDIIDSKGHCQIASHYYPLTGPYASGDTTIIEYQLLLMKLSGIDGVFIDWPGTIPLYDYSKNVINTEKIIAMLGKVGLNYATVYEDQNINIAYNKGTIRDKITAAQKDMRYLEKHYFGNANYEKLNGKPLLLVFGPQTFSTPTDWYKIFSILSTPPSFFTLWKSSNKAGKTATGEFAWINGDNIVSLNNFYSNSYNGIKIASAYPGFNTFYAKGGWNGPTFIINANGISNFKTTLSLALKSNVNYIQLPTWNDYGEGTMIEPTVEFQYSMLTYLQQKLGVSYGEADLILVSRLYKARIKYAGYTTVQKRLDQVFYYLVSLQIDKASSLLNNIG